MLLAWKQTSMRPKSVEPSANSLAVSSCEQLRINHCKTHVVQTILRGFMVDAAGFNTSALTASISALSASNSFTLLKLPNFRDNQLVSGLHANSFRRHINMLNEMVNMMFKHLNIHRRSPFRRFYIRSDGALSLT